MLTETKTPKRQEIKPFEPQKEKCHTQTCKRPLTYMKKTDCWRCLKCNPMVEARPTEKIPSKYLDVAMSEAAIQEIVDKAVAAALAKQAEVKPPKYKDEPDEASQSEPSDQNEDDEEPEILGKTLDQFPDKETTNVTKEN